MRPGRHETIVLEVPGTLKHRPVVLRTVSAACRLAVGEEEGPALEDLRTTIVTAVGEAFNNIAVHAYAGRADGRVSIEVHKNGEFFVVELTDDSHPFDFHAAVNRPLGEFPESGMGVFLITNTMDKFEYCPGPPNTLKLYKRIGRG